MPDVKKRAQKARRNPRQAVLGKRPEIIVEVEPDTSITRTITLTDKRFLCPFCLFSGYLPDFQVQLKSGKLSKKFQCPECGNGMIERTLTADMSAEEFAEWCFNYSYSGFWQKVPFEKFNSRLYKLGLSYRFWKKYKALKGNREEDMTEMDMMLDGYEEDRHRGFSRR